MMNKTPSKAYELIVTIKEAVQIISTHKDNGYRVRKKLVILSKDKEALILGDLHGDYKTFRKILEQTNFLEEIKEERGVLICLGDYIDRGPQQIELIHFLLNCLISYPDSIVLLRGNHEGPEDLSVRPHDFPAKLYERYGEEWNLVYYAFRTLFDNLYTAAIVEDKALFLHGGIPTKAKGLEDIVDAHLTHPMKPHLAEILWNDPSTKEGISPSFRGVGKQFGSRVATRFLDEIGVNMLVRGHECYDDGYRFHGERVLTLFSCKLPVYRNKLAAYVRIPLCELHDDVSLRRHIYQI